MTSGRSPVRRPASAFGATGLVAAPIEGSSPVPQPFIVSIPHKLGKEEALRRLKSGLGSLKTQYAHLVQVNEEIWSGDRLAFRITALKQQASGTLDVAEDHVKVEVILPWLLAGLAHGAQAVIRERGLRLLEKK
jgi:hypothetical protein